MQRKNFEMHKPMPVFIANESYIIQMYVVLSAFTILLVNVFFFKKYIHYSYVMKKNYDTLHDANVIT